MRLFHTLILVLLIINSMVFTPIFGTVGLTLKDPLTYTLILLIVHFVVTASKPEDIR